MSGPAVVPSPSSSPPAAADGAVRGDQGGAQAGGTSPRPLAAGMTLIAVAAAVVVGLWLRIAPLTTKSLWQDELWTLRRTDYATAGQVVTHLRGTPFPPVHYLLVYAWRQVCPDPVLGLRVPSLVCGLLTPPLTYLLWRPLVGRAASVWAALLTTLSAYHVWVSLDAKMYSAVWLLALVSHALFLRLLLTPGRPAASGMTVYVAATALLPLVSYTAASVPAVQGVYLVVRAWRGRSGRNDPLAAGLLLAALLPLTLWSPYLVAGVRDSQGLNWIGPARPENFWNDVRELLGLFLCGFRAADHGKLDAFGAWMIWLQGWSLTAAAIAACTVLARGGDVVSPGPTLADEAARRQVLGYVVVGVAVPIGGAFLFSLAFRSVWGVARYLTPIVPLLLVGVAIATTSLRSRAARIALLAPLVGVNLGMGWLDRTETTRIPWDRIAEQIVAHSPPTGTIVLWEDDELRREALMALPFELARRRGVDWRFPESLPDRVMPTEKFPLALREGVLIEFLRPDQGSPPQLRESWQDRYHFERLSSWDVFGKSDIPHPSIIGTVSVWFLKRHD